jgi:hypothetical protein
MREAWALRGAQSEIRETHSEEQEVPQSLADCLRAASKGLDHEEIAARLAVIRQGREVQERDMVLELERQAEITRERGLDHEL